MRLPVSNVHTGGGVVCVEFDDGHVATFAENTGGFQGGTHPVEQIRLEMDGHPTIAIYNSPYQLPVNRQPFGITRLAKGYTVSQVVGYWTAAFDHISATVGNDNLREAWCIVAQAVTDIHDLQRGRWAAP